MITDLHCHILPGIDDGAKDVSVSLQLLHREYADGVRQIALTSHFNSHRTSVKEFLGRRAMAYDKLMFAMGNDKSLANHTCELDKEKRLSIKLGAEVFFSPQLMDLEAERLCMEGTSYILIEFPVTHRPHFIRQTFNDLNNRGIFPIIAHVERYPYMMENPQLLYELVAAGAYAQINANALLKAGQSKHLLKLIKWNLVHVISTDTHSLDKRPPQMNAALNLIEQKLGKDTAEWICMNGTDLFHDKEIDYDLHFPRKFLGKWV